MPKLSEVTGNAPQQLKLSQVSPGANFGGVSSSIDSSEFVQPEIYDARGNRIPSLEEVNAANRAYRSSPQYAQDRAAEKESQLRQKTAEFRDLPLPARVLMGAGSRIPTAAMGVGQILGVTDNADAAKQRESARFMEGDAAAGVGKFAGDMALWASPGSAVGKLPTLTGRMLGSTGLGAAVGAVGPVVDGESRAFNAGAGGAFGLGGQAVGEGAKALGRALSPEIKAIAEAARARGIELTPAQLSNSNWIKYAQSRLKSLPFSGAQNASDRQQQAFMKSLAKSFGADADVLSDEVMTDARRRLSAGFEDIYNKSQINVGESGLRKLTGVENSTASRLVAKDAGVVRNQLNMVLGELDEYGMLTGQKYQALRTKIMKAEGSDRIGEAVKEVRKALDEIAEQSVSPQHAKRLKELRGQWANLKTTQDLLKQVAGSEGQVKPSAVWPAIRNGSTKEMRDLGRIGQRMKEPPSSGTPEGAMALNAWNPLNWPGIGLQSLVGATAGRATNSKWLAQLMEAESRPVVANSLARLSAPSGVAAAPSATPSLYNLFYPIDDGGRK